VNKKLLSSAFLTAIILSGLIFVSMRLGTVHASTDISGLISSDTTWTLAGSPYIVTGDVLVEAGVLLTIEAGVVVKFDGGTNLIVDGTLVANGDETHPVTFTSNAATPAPNDWGTINFRGSSTASIMKWASISYASDGVTVTSGSPTIEKCSISNNQRYGIYVSAGTPKIISSTISNNGKDGIWNYVGDITVTNSTISNNQGNGIYKDSKSITVQGSVISNNHQSGIYGGAGGAFAISDCEVSYNGHNGVTIIYSEVSVNNSEIIYNDQDGVHMASGTLSGSATITGTTISNNNGNGVYKSSGSMQITNNTIKFNNVGVAATPFKLVGADSFQEKSGDTIIQYNNIVDNTLYAVENIGPGTNIFGAVLNLTATNNWWGTTDTSLIDQLIKDVKDDFNLGRVEYVPFLTEPASVPSSPSPTPTPTPTPTATPTPTPTPAPTPSPSQTAFISITTESTSTVVGSPITVSGRLYDSNGQGIANEIVLLSYTFTGSNSWTPISSDLTSSSGEYSIQWINTASGTFTLNATWNGNDEYLGASATTTLSFLPYENQQYFFVESNSTVSALAFNSTSLELSFTVNGTEGTAGYVKVTIAKNLVANAENIKVYMDGEQLNYEITSNTDSWLLSFTYTHSTHDVMISLAASEAEEKFLGIDLILIAVVVVIVVAGAVGFIVWRKKKQP
jgi:parallel beta-helix repeat protein